MNPKNILFPVYAQVFLTGIVWVVLFYTRLGTLRRKRANPQVLATESRSQEILQDVVNPSDNFENQFEMPVLFYVAALLLYVTNNVDQVFVTLAWGFVGLRIVHSFIHCTYNRIMHRFYSYALSSILIWVIWIRITLQLAS